ncbi:MAG TPA: hypothetical protein VHR84_06255 [Terriglobales bacterium]|nr:hypothetical protein [Terriglobales bacterium]
MSFDWVNRCGCGPTLVTIPVNQLVQVIAERAIGLKGLFIKEPFDPTPEAHLIRLALNADRPAHLAMPAATESNHGGTCDSGGNKA